MFIVAAQDGISQVGASGREFFRGLVLIAIFLGIIAWLAWRSLRRSDVPMLLVTKWAASAVMFWVTFFVVAPYAMHNPFLGVPLAAACGLVYAVIWRGSIVEILSKPFSAIFDGGEQELEPRPLYSAAIAKRKQGRFREAMYEIQGQLQTFPEDFEGQFMLAEIAAENLQDVDAAERTIFALCEQPQHPRGAVSMALNALADWHLKQTQDRERAHRALQKIEELFPETEVAALAAQRIGHLASMEHIIETREPRKFVLTPGVENLGLMSPDQRPHLGPEDNPAQRAVECVEHLGRHPMDADVREELALLYARYFQRLDLASEQLERLIATPHISSSRVTKWLHLLADLQVEGGETYEVARNTLQRIVDRDPGSAAAEVARNRIAHLKLSLRKKDRSQTVKLGSYEQDIGLKRSPKEHE